MTFHSFSPPTRKPKILLGLVLVLSGANIVGCADEPSALKVMIDLGAPYAGDAGQGRKIEPPALHLRANQAHPFYVVLENISSKPISDEILDLTFEITADDGKTVIARPVAAYMIEQAFQIDPGEVMVAKVNYFAANFHVASPSTSEPIVPGEFPFEFPFPIAGQSKKVTIRAVLKNEPAGASAGRNLWWGKATSKPYDVILTNDSL